ncbi:MAG: twin-arginine translocation signal domain-containing protein, partial [Thermoanaerobaculia bacterium]|nr:twin-arginine translocation signal domain-containing protein [Thermoanaerobaculia bacterium]
MSQKKASDPRSEVEVEPAATAPAPLSRRKVLAGAAVTAAGVALAPAVLAQPTRRLRVPVNPRLIDLQRL